MESVEIAFFPLPEGLVLQSVHPTTTVVRRETRVQA